MSLTWDQVARWLGMTGRRAAGRAWRQAAAAAEARPDEVWTLVYESRQHAAWTSGPIGLMDVEGLLGDELLPQRAWPLNLFTVARPSLYRVRLVRGTGRMPGLLAAATGADLAKVRTGARIMAEHQDPAFPGLRLIDDGQAGPVRTRGERGRYVGTTWVPLAHVVGLDGSGEAAPRRPAVPRRPFTSTGQLAADGGLTAEVRP